MKIETIQITNPACTLAYALWEPESTECKGTVVAVHGVSRQKRDFDFIADYLAKNGYRVLAVDAPGRGGSSSFNKPEDYSLPVYADVFRSFLQNIEVQNAHWIGSSMGGLIALAMAQKGYGHLLQSVTLVDITHQPNRAACERIAGYFTENLPVLQSVEQMVGFTKKNLPLGQDIPDSVWWHFAEHQLIKIENGFTLHFDPKIVRQAREDMLAGIDFTEGLKKLTCPLALVAGGISDLCTPKEIEDLKLLRPDIRLHICSTAGHIPALSDVATQAFVADFLASAAPQNTASPRPLKPPSASPCR